MTDGGCSHIQNLETLLTAKAYECEQCVKMGSDWVHLRTCQTCGVTLCCDSSPNRHASRHAHEADHPIARSVEPGEHWLWCYVDEQLVRYG